MTGGIMVQQNQRQTVKISLVLAITLSLFFPIFSCAAATLHAIIVADTEASRIGESVRVDLGIMQGLIDDIARYTGMASAGRAISGSEVNYHTVMNAVNSLSVGSDDTIIFYYAGHGLNPSTDSYQTAWPALDITGGEIPLKTVRETLKATNPRLLIVMADTCNGLSNRGGFAQSRTGKSAHYKTLFLKYQGTITASAAQPGEYGWSNPQIGGFFTNAFITSLNKELISTQTPSWEAIFSEERATAPLNNGEQHPQAKVEVQLIGSVHVPPSPVEDVNSPGETHTGTCKTRYRKGGQNCCQDWQGREHCWSLKLD
jgi:hypothetical protein